MNNKGFSTKAIHGGSHSGSAHPLTTPIFQSSTFVFDSIEDGAMKFSGEREGFIYTRLSNPTVDEFERKMALLENGESALAFSSGMAAISSVLLTFLHSSDHIVCSRGLYGCTFGLLEMMKEQYGIQFSLIDMRDESAVISAITENTKLFFLETPINPTMEMADIASISKIAKENEIKVVVDNTFASPYLQRPLELGADIVVHSATKYIGGHGDVIAGVAIGNASDMNLVKRTRKDMGGVLSPNDAFLLTRGLKTLHIRMQRHCENAMKVALFLENHSHIEKVYYPGLKNFSQFELAQKQMSDFGGILSFEVKGGKENAIKMANKLQMIKIAVSLGDTETLIQHPYSMTHAVVPEENRIEMGITDSLLRLSVGIEDADDIIEDLKQALEL